MRHVPQRILGRTASPEAPTLNAHPGGFALTTTYAGWLRLLCRHMAKNIILLLPIARRTIAAVYALVAQLRQPGLLRPRCPPIREHLKLLGFGEASGWGVVEVA
jgi:hypothetical protein